MFQNRIFYITLATFGIFFVWYIIAPSNENASGGKGGEVTLNNPENYAKGNADAPVKIIQYSDFLCPSCSQVSLGVMPKIEEEFVKTGKAYFEFRPLAFIADGSQLAAEGAFCAAQQNKFWEFHDKSYLTVWTNYFSKGVDPTQVPLYSIDGVKTIGKASGVDEATFNTCIDERQKQQEVINFTEYSQSKVITGTPYFLINDTPIKGVPTYEVLEAAINSKL